MAEAASRMPPRRHPWLDRLIAAPEAELRALVGGYAEIPPYGRAEPADAAASLLFGIPPDDPARAAFDTGCLALMGSLRTALLHAAAEQYDGWAARMDRLIAVIRRTKPDGTVRELHRHYARWLGVMETGVVDRGLDLRREFWRLLALTQNEAGMAQPRRLMALWHEICAEAGSQGRYNETYLDVGVTGLACLPLGAEDDGNEEAVCHGLARWAERQRPAKTAFLTRWREIEQAWPRTPTYWPPLVDDVLNAVEEELSGDENMRRTFPAAVWWRDEMELPARPRTKHRPAQQHPRHVQPPRRELREGILHDIASPVATLQPRITRLMDQHRAYADATGDVFYLIRTASNVGMRLVRNAPAGERGARGCIAVELARTALEYAPANPFAWGLWGEGLEAQGHLEAAELLGWETIRRFPEDPNYRTQLAKLLAEACRRPDEACQLLREAIALFPDNATARTQLAGVLAEDLGEAEAARGVLEEAIRRFPDQTFGYSQLAILLADGLDDRAEAIRVLREAQSRFPDNTHYPRMIARAEVGQRLGRRRDPPAAPVLASVPTDFPIDLSAARARRALFRAETSAGDAAALDELRKILAEDEGLAYVRYVAQRTGITAAQGIPDTAFAFAFDRAAREGSAAAFQALMTQFEGMERVIAGIGLTLVSGGDQFDLPAAANDPGSDAHRLAAMVGGFSKALKLPGTDRAPMLRLLNHFAAAALSLDIAA